MEKQVFPTQHVSVNSTEIRKEDLKKDREEWIAHVKEENKRKKREMVKTIVREITERVIQTSRYEGKTHLAYSMGYRSPTGGFYGDTTRSVKMEHMPNTDGIVISLKEKFPDSRITVFIPTTDPDTYMRTIHIDWE
jgi:hypothetical protein